MVCASVLLVEFFAGSAPMDRLTVRRKLLQGSLSAPLVMTVTAAGANVNTTFGACLDRAGAADPRIVDPGYSADMLYRVEVDITKVLVDGTAEYYIPSAPNSDLFYKLTDPDSPYALASTTPTALPGQIDPSFSKKVMALGYWDKHTGGLESYVYGDSTTVYTTKSCYASVFP